MNSITVALLQMTACGNDQAANRAKGEVFCRRACEMGADIALFPEMWNIGPEA
jgi:predicted amidohydrolase